MTSKNELKKLRDNFIKELSDVFVPELSSCNDREYEDCEAAVEYVDALDLIFSRYLASMGDLVGYYTGAPINPKLVRTAIGETFNEDLRREILVRLDQLRGQQ